MTNDIGRCYEKAPAQAGAFFIKNSNIEHIYISQRSDCSGRLYIQNEENNFMGYLMPLFIVMQYFICWGCGGRATTPKEYKYVDTVNIEIYKKAISEITDSVKNRITLKENPYYQSENDSSTIVLIDTILYRPTLDKIAFIVITQNSNNKLLEKGKKNESHYDAHCFIGICKNNKIVQFAWVSAFSLSNYRDKYSASNDIRSYYFTELTSGINKEGKSPFKYNFDDVRFWEGPIWKKYF